MSTGTTGESNLRWELLLYGSFLVVSLALAVSYILDIPGYNQPETVLWARLVSYATAVLVVINVLTVAYKLYHGTSLSLINESLYTDVTNRKVNTVLQTMVPFAYLTSIITVGFFTSSAVFLFAYSYAYDRSIKQSVLLSIIFTIASYILIIYVLNAYSILRLGYLI